MPNTKAVLGLVAGVLSLVAGIVYVLAILRGETKPNRVTWWVWSFIGVTIVLNYRASGATHTIWIPVAYAMEYVLVAILSLRYGVGGREKSDIVAGAIAGTSMLLWWWFGSQVALGANLVADFAAIFPTIRKTYQKPQTEDRLAWVTTSIACVLNLFAIEKWMLAITILPVYMVVVNGTIAILALRRNNI